VKQERANPILYLLVFVVLMLAPLVWVALRPAGTLVGRAVRGLALSGYLAVFLAILSSAYMRQLYRRFGRPFIKVHHTFSITGLVLITLHPVAAAWQSGTISTFLPVFYPLSTFLALGGRLAWYLIAAAALAAWIRKRLGQNWRILHYLTYIGFGLATPHAFMIGTELQVPLVKGIFAAMALVVVVVFVVKRLPERR